MLKMHINEAIHAVMQMENGELEVNAVSPTAVLQLANVYMGVLNDAGNIIFRLMDGSPDKPINQDAARMLGRIKEATIYFDNGIRRIDIPCIDNLCKCCNMPKVKGECALLNNEEGEQA